MKKLIALFILIAGLSQAAAIDPATHFTNFPWAGNTNKFWQEVDSTNHMIKQIMLALSDRCEAIGNVSLGLYVTNQPLYAGYKTNYTYQVNGTNVHPYLQLQMTQTVINVYSNFYYYYPVNAGQSGDGVIRATGVVYVTSEMLDKLNSGITGACPFYVQAGVVLGDYFRSNSGGLYPDSAPLYNMPALLVDAGYSNNVSNLTYNAWGVITDGDWNWQTQLPSNGIVTLAALDERAACIAQLKTVCFSSRSCSPFRYYERQSKGSWDADTNWVQDSLRFNESVITNYFETDRKSFAWHQTSIDTNYTPSILSSNNAWTNAISNYLFNDIPIFNNAAEDPTNWANANFHITNNPSDWPSNGWYYDFSALGQVDMTRPNTNQGIWFVADRDLRQMLVYITGLGTTRWQDREPWYDEWVNLWQINPSMYIAQTRAHYFSGITSNDTLSMPFKTMVSKLDFSDPELCINQTNLGFKASGRTPVSWTVPVASQWRDVEFTYAPNTNNFYSDFNIPITMKQTNIYNTTNAISVTNLADEVINSKEFITWGKYATSSYHSVKVSFTNTETIPPYTNKVLNVEPLSVVTLDSVSSVFTDTTRWFCREYFKSNGFWSAGSNWREQHASQTNSGSITYSNITWNTLIWERAEVYSLKPDIRSIYTNAPSTTTVWIAGGVIDQESYNPTAVWRKDTRMGANQSYEDVAVELANNYDWLGSYSSWGNEREKYNRITEWNEGNYTWEADAAFHTNPITANSYTNVASFDTQASLENGMIYYKWMWDEDQTMFREYRPFHNTPRSRCFWGISNAYFIIDYAFTNHF